MLVRLRKALGERLAYVFRQFPNERAHPGAEFAAQAAEAAARQGRFWEMHDALYAASRRSTGSMCSRPPARSGSTWTASRRDLADPQIRERVEEDLADGRRNGVTATPTIFVDGQRYDGAWDFYSMLEALERPVGARVQRTARAFANLPASAGLVLLIAAAAAVVCVNTPLAGALRRWSTPASASAEARRPLSLTVGDWCSEGLLTVFFLLVGLEIRREMTAGAFTDLARGSAAGALRAIGGSMAPALIYLALNRGATAPGWSAPTSTGIAFALGMLAVLGARAPSGLKVFVAALAVVDDILSMLILASSIRRISTPVWLIASAAAVGLMFALNRWRVYAGWPYLLVTLGLWLSLYAAGVSAELAGVVLAVFLPTRPAPAAGPLLAQAATALAALEHAETEAREAGGDKPPSSRSRSGSGRAAISPPPATRLLVARRARRARRRSLGGLRGPAAVRLHRHGRAARRESRRSARRAVLAGAALGLAIGKPLGIVLAGWAAVKASIAVFPDATRLAFLGAALLCGVGDPLSLLMVEQAFHNGPYADVGKIGILAGSALAAALGAVTLAFSRPPLTEAAP